MPEVRRGPERALPGARLWLLGTGSVPGAGQSPDLRRLGLLSVAAWVLVLALGLNALAGSAGVPADFYGDALVVVYLLLVGRLVLAGVVWPRRRTGSAALAVSIGSLVIGAVLTGVISGMAGRLSVPVVLAFVVFELAKVVFVLAGEGGRSRFTLSNALDAVIVCGGAGSLAGMLVSSPLDDKLLTRSIGDLVVILLFSTVDAMLLIVVLGAAVLGRRAWSARTLALLAGLAVLAANTQRMLVDNISAEQNFSPGVVFVWALGLSLLATSACGPETDRDADAAVGVGAGMLVLAGTAAGIVLMVDDLQTDPAVTILALATMAATMSRMALALREARGAAEARRLAQTDELTGLPNRRALMARIDEADAKDEQITLMSVGVDDLKSVYDTLGHPAGEAVLQRIGRRLAGAAPSRAFVARVEGAEFAVVVPASAFGSGISAGTAWARTVIAEPVQVVGTELTLGCSVGVAFRKPAAFGAAELLRRADLAMAQARTVAGGVAAYRPENDDFSPDGLRRVADLRRALPGGQIEVWYQPQVDAQENHVVGMEALVRWAHPELGLVPPGQFLPLARQSGLMPALTVIILETVLDDVRRLLPLRPEAKVSFNVAPFELLDRALMARLLTAIDQARLAPGTLVLEITEDSLLANPERAAATLQEVSAHGVEVSIDDYGTGYSSLAYLRDLPVSELKMDRSFVTAAATDSRSRLIVASTARLAHDLGLRTVAEGVEDAETASVLAGFGVDTLQGYHFARPMPYDQLRPWLASAAGRPSPIRQEQL